MLTGRSEGFIAGRPDLDESTASRPTRWITSSGGTLPSVTSGAVSPAALLPGPGLPPTGYVGEVALAAARGVIAEGGIDPGAFTRAELA